MKKIIVNTDMGIDDALALLAAYGCKGVDLLGVGLSYGSDTLTRVEDKAIRMASFAGEVFGKNKKILMVSGASKPFHKKYNATYDVHGFDSYDHLDKNFDIADIKKEQITKFLDSQIVQNKHTVSLISLGPLTNIARFCIQFPGHSAYLKELVIMGGALWYGGNYNPLVEANFGWDPEALLTTLSAGFNKITIVPLNVTEQIQLTPDVTRIFPAAFRKGIQKLTKHYIDFYKNTKKYGIRPGSFVPFQYQGGVMHDVVAVLYAYDNRVLQTKKMSVGVVSDTIWGGHIYPIPSMSKTQNAFSVNVAIDINIPLFWRIFRSIFS